MLRRFAWLMLLVPLAVSCTPAMMMGSRTYLGFSVGIDNAPPPPRVEFEQAPATEEVPGAGVFVVDDSDYDMFQCDGYWYMSYGGYWYRAPSYSGPFLVVDVHRVPRQILTLPHERWKHDPRGDYGDRDRGRRDRGDEHGDRGYDHGDDGGR